MCVCVRVCARVRARVFVLVSIHPNSGVPCQKAEPIEMSFGI